MVVPCDSRLGDLTELWWWVARNLIDEVLGVVERGGECLEDSWLLS